jgi:hypothetical protein
MSATSDLLDRVREGANIPSDNVLSQRLGITRAVISGWRNGNYPVPDERIAQLCDMAKLDGPLWMALIHAERATSAVERKIWRLMLDRISAAAAVVALVALSLPSVGNAKTAQNQAVSDSLLTHSVYYVQDRLGIDSATKSGQWHPGHPPVSNPSHSASAPMVACAQGYPATSRRHTSLVRRTSPNQRSNSKGTPSPQPRRIQRQAAPQPP